MNEKKKLKSSTSVAKKGTSDMDKDVYSNVLKALESVMKNSELSPEMQKTVEGVIKDNMGQLGSIVSDFTEKAVESDSGEISQKDMVTFMEKMKPIIEKSISSMMPREESSSN